MTNPITPPPELVDQWASEWRRSPTAGRDNFITAQAAQWAADQELEACCEWLVKGAWFSPDGDCLKGLRAARRPKPPSLKEQALGALGRFNTNTHTRADEMTQDFDLIRTALEALDD
jgi:hypothetical protein